MVLRASVNMKGEMKIAGYADRYSVEPGNKIRFMVSCELPSYHADIVRMIHGDDNPRGPGLKVERVKTPIDGDYEGRNQEFRQGSYVRVPRRPRLDLKQGFTLLCWIYPTTPSKGVQGLVTKWSEAPGSGYGLFVDSEGRASLKLKSKTGEIVEANGGKQLHGFTWYFVAASFDPTRRRITVHQEALGPCRLNESTALVEKSVDIEEIEPNGLDLLIGAYWADTSDGPRPDGFYNGKIDSPKVVRKALASKDIEALKGDDLPSELRKYVVADWDFSRDVHSTRVRERSTGRADGITVNFPTRAVTGHNWSGQVHDFKDSPKEYAAIYFHDDDLGDAGWDADFELRVPERMRSGVYAARLTGDGSVDYIPFYVRAKRGKPTSKVAFLASTLNYLAYGNCNFKTLGIGVDRHNPIPMQPPDEYIERNKLKSLYDRHSDGSGVCYASRLRPIVTDRPGYDQQQVVGGTRCPHGLNGDLHLLDWLEAMGFDYDIITDEDLHEGGLSAISHYRVIITGSHPEYCTQRMMEALEVYLNKGGRMMYLGGNGFYWVTSINPESPYMIEVRRWGGTGSWKAEPGEYYSSFTGELGGIWRNRGMAPQKLFGIGFTAQGVDKGRPYVRGAGSYEKSASFIFQKVGKDELVGNFNSLVMEFGGAGLELDRADFALGTPSHTLILATATGFSDYYQHVIEENLASDDKQGGSKSPLVKADMVYLRYPRGGAVFSVGSISWCGSLSFNDYKNNVSQITENVLRKFYSQAPLT